MAEYMVQVAFQGEPGAALLAVEQQRIAELATAGTLRSLHLAADRSSGWLVLRGETPAEVQRVLQSLPLYPHLGEPTITLLAAGPGGD